MDFKLPPVRGTLTPGRSLSELTWLRVGGPADVVFQPADADDLSAFLRDLPSDVPVFPMGVGSNLIVRDGGLRAVVIRLGRGFNNIDVTGDVVTAGAAALDALLRTRCRHVRVTVAARANGCVRDVQAHRAGPAGHARRRGGSTR